MGLDNNFVWVFHGRLGPHADRPSGSGCLDDGMVRLGGSLAVQIKDLTDRVGTLEDFDFTLARSLAGILGPPHDLDRFNIIGNGKGLDGTKSTFRDGTLHGVLGVGFPDVLLEGDQLLGSIERRNLGTERAREFLGSGSGDLECLLALGECEHALVRCLGTVFEVHVHGVQETDGSFPSVT